MVKVLQLVGGGVAIGGVEKMLLNYYAYMDKDKVRFDFCFFRRNTLVNTNYEFSDLLKNAQVYDLQLFEGRSKFLGYIRSISLVKNIIKKNEYEVVHINAGRPPLLLSGLIAATLAGAKIRITHSHSTKGVSGRSKLADVAYTIGFSLVRPFFRRLSTHLAACSTEAAKYMFGDNIVHSAKYIPIHNAIILKPYLYDEKIRGEVREEFGVDINTLVLGHIGSFSTPKNHMFLIDVFKSIKERVSNVVLWLAGDGTLRSSVEKKILDYGLNDSVLFLGERNDANRLYQGIDVLVFPSLWEGLSVTLVEAQAAALPVFASSNISPEHKITNRIKFIDLDKGADSWANIIVRGLEDLSRREDMSKQLSRMGYNIEIEAKKLQEFYINAISDPI